MNIKTRLKRKKLMISTPFIDNWIVTGSKVINYHLSNFVDQSNHETVSSHTSVRLL